MTAAACNDRRTYAVPSLLKSAFYACNGVQRDVYYEHEVPHVDLQTCCESLFEIVRLNTECGFDQLGGRRTMFAKVQAANRAAFKGICETAAHHGHIDCLTFAHEIGVPFETDNWYTNACRNAAARGHTECLVYAHQNGCPWDECATGRDGCPWDSWTCAMVAFGGHVDCLAYAHQNGCPWDAKTCSKAAAGGHVDCLAYAHQNGCPWDQETYGNAEEMGHEDCLAYARQNGCPRVL